MLVLYFTNIHRRLIATIILALILIIGHNNSSYCQNSFKPGEELRYIVYFGPIDAGEAKINLYRAIHKNEQVFHSKLVARSIGLPDKIYRIKDTYECYFDSVTVLPYMAIRDIREGRKYRKKNIDNYDHNNNIIYCGNKGEIEMSTVIRDVISTFYFIRNYDFTSLQEKDVIKIDLLFDDELMTFRMHYMGKEMIETRIGKFNCLKLVPEIVESNKTAETENVSPTPKDEMTIWLSDDANQVPVRVKFDLFVGSIKADLVEYINLKY
jgi:hypothetical protein